MAIAESTNLEAYCLDVAQRAEASGRFIDGHQWSPKKRLASHRARSLRDGEAVLKKANELDIAAAPQFGLSAAQIDRLRLTTKVIESMATSLDEIAAMPDPIGEVMESSMRPNGLEVLKVRVPLGVIFFIYESRPNVTSDAAAIAIKSGNAVILRGGKEAAHSNRAVADLLTAASREVQIPEDAVQLVSTTDRLAVGHFLGMSQYIDVAIPRGGEGLIRRVAAEAKMPVIKHFTGNCHVYVDQAADLEMAERITVNAKCQRMGVCNAAESLVVHSAIAQKFLPPIGKILAERGIEIRGDRRACEWIGSAVPASEDDYSTEYLGPIISVKVVDSLQEAIEHINHHSSQHTEAIVTSDLSAARRFVCSDR